MGRANTFAAPELQIVLTDNPERDSAGGVALLPNTPPAPPGLSCTPADIDLPALRRDFASLHGALRNEGRHPLEAIGITAKLLSRKPSIRKSSSALVAEPSRRAADKLLASGVTGHALSVAFQELLSSEARNGLGQYLTPMPVADLVAEFCRASHPDNVLDPFAGSALLLERAAALLPASSFTGIEINETTMSIAESVVSLGDAPIHLRNADSFQAWLANDIEPVDAVITNPPFGSVLTELVGSQIPTSLSRMTRIPAELLGLELSIQVLRDGGFLGIVLPQSVMTNGGWNDYRKAVFSRLSVQAIISLPEETFAPFKGVAKACVLLATKHEATLPTVVPFARSQSVGWDSTGRIVGEGDLAQVIKDVTTNSVSANAVVAEDGSFRIPPRGDHLLDPSSFYVLGDIAEVFIGRTFPRDQYTEVGPRLVKVGDLSGNFLSWRQRARTNIPPSVFATHTRYRLREGDICLTAAAHRPHYIGLKVDLLDQLPSEGAMASAEVMVIRMSSTSPIRAEHLLYYLRSKTGYGQIQDIVRGSTAHLYPKDVCGMLIPRLERRHGADDLVVAFRRASTSFRSYLKDEERALRAAAEVLGPEAVEIAEDPPVELMGST